MVTSGLSTCVLVKISKVCAAAGESRRAASAEGICPIRAVPESAEVPPAMPSSRGRRGRGLQVGRQRSYAKAAENEGRATRRPIPISAGSTMRAAPRRAAKARGCAAPLTPSGNRKTCLATETGGLASTLTGLCTRTSA